MDNIQLLGSESPVIRHLFSFKTAMVSTSQWQYQIICNVTCDHILYITKLELFMSVPLLS